MTKIEFLSAFRFACAGLPESLVELAVTDFERQFTDQLISGKSEEVIVEQWGAPQNAALKLKLGTLNGNLREVVTVQKVARVGVSGLRLVATDILLIIPALVYLAILFAFYIAGVLMYLAGIFTIAASISGVNYVDVPASYFPPGTHLSGKSHLTIGEWDGEPVTIASLNGMPVQAAPNVPGSDGVGVEQDTETAFRFTLSRHSSGLMSGIGTFCSGMALIIFCMLMTGFTFRMCGQFARWHLTVLRS